MRPYLPIFIAISAVLLSPAAYGRQSLAEDHIDSLVASHKVITIGGQPSRSEAYVDSVKSLIENFYYDQFRHFQDPAAPYFLFMSKDASLAMGIGGCVRMRGYYDWGGAMPGTAVCARILWLVCRRAI